MVLTELPTTSIGRIDETREHGATAYSHCLVGTVVVGIVEVRRKLDHNGVLYDFQGAAVSMTSALSEECHVLGIGILDLRDEVSRCGDRFEDVLIP